jgi:hypothetical protein
MFRKQNTRRLYQECLYFSSSGKRTARIRKLHPARPADSSHIASSAFSCSVINPAIPNFFRKPVVHSFPFLPQDVASPLRANRHLNTIPFVLHSLPVIKGSPFRHCVVSFTRTQNHDTYKMILFPVRILHAGLPTKLTRNKKSTRDLY